MLLRDHISPYFPGRTLQNNFISLFLRLGLIFMSHGGSFATLEKAERIFSLFKMYFAK